MTMVVEAGHYRLRLKNIVECADFNRDEMVSLFLDICEEIRKSKLHGDPTALTKLRWDLRQDASGLHISKSDRALIVRPTMDHVLLERRSVLATLKLESRQSPTPEWKGGPRAAGVGGAVSGHRYL